MCMVKVNNKNTITILLLLCYMLSMFIVSSGYQNDINRHRSKAFNVNSEDNQQIFSC